MTSPFVQLRALYRHPLLVNSGWIFSGQGVSLVLQATYFVVIARLLGSMEYGVLVGASASVGVLSQYGAFGSGLLFLRYVSPDRTLARQYWGNILLSCLLFGTLLVLLLWFGAPIALPRMDRRIILCVALSECVCAQLTTAASQVFQSLERMRWTAMLSMATGATRLLLALILLMTVHRTQALGWASVSMLISLLTAMGSYWLVARNLGHPLFRPRLFLQRSWEGFIFAVSGSTTSLYNDVDKAMLSHFGMTEANGIYSMAYRVVDVGTIPIRSLHAAAFPRFFQRGATSGGMIATARFARKLLARTSPLGLIVGGALFLSAPVIPHLVGQGFGPSVAALRWLCLIPLFRSFHLSAGDALAGAGKQTMRLIFQAAAAAMNITMNVFWIPRYSWRGAAWASLCTDAGLGVMLWVTVGWMTYQAESKLKLSSTTQRLVLHPE